MTQIRVCLFCHWWLEGICSWVDNMTRSNGGCAVGPVAPKLRLRGLALVYLAGE